MIKTLGKRMGLKFEYDAANYMHSRYGGHPLLTRMACSVTNIRIKEKKEKRPVTLTVERLQEEETLRDSELMFYCRHVVSELKQFYPDEYEMLELLSSGQVHDFVDLAAYPEYTKHLHSYGLLTNDQFNRPAVAIPVIQRYVALELARKEGRQTLFRVIPKDERSDWLEKRKSSIMHDIRLFEKAVEKIGVPILYGPNSFPEADQFAKVEIVKEPEDFVSFINTCNKCFVEAVENYGKSIGLKNYYWQEIKNSYPGFWYSLQRIKSYRHENMHLLLTKQASVELQAFLVQDLEGRNPNSVKDSFFILQQCVLDGLLTGIQIELSKLT